jgi:biotin carboxyl carrier protein
VSEGHKKKLGILLVLAAIASVVVPALFWRGTWFGRPLDDDLLNRYLADTERPRHVQHALSQISDRIARGDPTVKAFQPKVLELAKSPERQVRITAAWVLGQDTDLKEAQGVLREMLADPEPMVRRNAALALVRFGDAAGHDEILAMLRPTPIPSPATGTLKLRLKPDDTVDVDTLLAHVEGPSSTLEVRSNVPGRVLKSLAEEGASVEKGAPIYLLASSDDEVFEALRALYLIGRPEDLADVTAASGPGTVVSTRVQQQASLTAESIRGRNR